VAVDLKRYASGPRVVSYIKIFALFERIKPLLLSGKVLGKFKDLNQLFCHIR